MSLRILIGWGLVACSALAAAQEPTTDPLADGLRPFCGALSGTKPFTLSGTIEMPTDGRTQAVSLALERYSDESFDLALTHTDYAVHLRRRGEATAMALPKHGVVFVGSGDVDAGDHLAPAGIVERLCGARSMFFSVVFILSQTDPQILSGVLRGLVQVAQDPATGRWTVQDKPSQSFEFPEAGALALSDGKWTVRLRVGDAVATPPDVRAWPGLREESIERSELERTLARGARRALEILAPSPALTNPSTEPRRVPHGQLRWIDGQRVALLSGSPEQIGRAHGALLREEALACVDSVLYTFGTVQTIQRGRWFRHELEEAYAHLKPHIPARHLAETRAMAQALSLHEATVEAVNVFPEMFHCSGFALFGKATSDGKLYHGRVLDYMTEIGLQDAATTFVISADGQIPFANVGYAGFIGSVSGMNAESISLGEMGGRGEGQWDGVPMATLMRRGLEECRTLDEVMKLWTTSPRTCEYYFVFADGKTNRAVGVAAVPESIEFIQPGQSHPRLGDGIEDAVVLSAGDRLEMLRERVQSKYGQVDAELGQWLMSRPVAMKSNLHNVLFVPQDGILYVANADHRHCAAERPYVRLDLRELLAGLAGSLPAASSAASPANDQ